MRDLLPADMRAFHRVEDAFRRAASRWGYEEIRTPTIETYRLFTAAGALTPQMLSRVYSFLDWDGWSGERVVLRPDSTIPVARAVTDAGMALPVRLSYVQNVFRFSEDGDREDWQCGIEYLGAPATIGDLEVAAVACDTMDALSLQFEVRLSHIGIARAALEALSGEAGVSPAMLDRLADEGLAALRPAAAANPQLAAFIEVALQPGGTALLENLAALAAPVLPAAVGAIHELHTIAAALHESGRTVVIDLGLPRDFEYYTGVVFEFTSGGQSWGGGGRYRPGGPGTPETACGLGLETEQLASHISASTRRPHVIPVVPREESDMARAILAVRELHRAGLGAALSESAGDAEMVVTASGGQLSLRTPLGERPLANIQDAAMSLLQNK